jgi:EAL domain-containing protein (putative c-di-GMP-specific phosphodiesterase class I)
MFTRGFTALAEALPLDRMAFEVTEHQPIDDYERLRDVAADLRSRGALLVVDDAGAGFASLRHILKLEPDVIKLDIALTRDIDRDPVKRALASSLATFAGDIGAAITAEGIETHAELLALRALGIDYGQGFFLAQPGSARAANQTAVGAPVTTPSG